MSTTLYLVRSDNGLTARVVGLDAANEAAERMMGDPGVLEVRTTPVDPELGPCACPACGWDDRGALRVRDWYADEMPPIPRPRGGTFVVQGSDDEVSVAHDIEECGQCGGPLSPESVVPR